MSAVASPAKGSKKIADATYFELIGETSKPIADRKELPIGRHGALTKPRRHHPLPDEIEAYRLMASGTKADKANGVEAVAADEFPNPFNQSNYFYIVEALKNLGLNRFHAYSDFYKEIKRIMGLAATRKGEGDDATTAWERFAGKESRSENGLDVQGKLLQNVEVIQRVTGLNCYGLKINYIGKEVLGGKGACIDLSRKNETSPVYIRLNTRPENFVVFNPTKGPMKGETIEIALPQNDLKTRRTSDMEVKVVKPKAKKPAPKKAKKPAPKAKTVKHVPAEVADVAEVAEVAAHSEPVAETADAESELVTA